MSNGVVCHLTLPRLGASRATLALSYPSPCCGEGRPQRSGGGGGGDVRMRSLGIAGLHLAPRANDGSGSCRHTSPRSRSSSSLRKQGPILRGLAVGHGGCLLQSSPAKAGDPVRREFSIPSPPLWNTGSSAFAGDDRGDDSALAVHHTHLRDLAVRTRVVLFVVPSETSEGAGNAGRSMRPQPRMQK